MRIALFVVLSLGLASMSQAGDEVKRTYAKCLVAEITAYSSSVIAELADCKGDAELYERHWLDFMDWDSEHHFGFNRYRGKPGNFFESATRMKVSEPAYTEMRELVRLAKATHKKITLIFWDDKIRGVRLD